MIVLQYASTDEHWAMHRTSKIWQEVLLLFACDFFQLPGRPLTATYLQNTLNGDEGDMTEALLANSDSCSLITLANHR